MLAKDPLMKNASNKNKKMGTLNGTGNSKNQCTLRFEAAKLEILFPVLDAISWLDLPNIKQISQFAGIDNRTAGKLIKNGTLIGIVGNISPDNYALNFPYPFKGSIDQKKAVLREALLRMPLIISLRQFLSLGNEVESATRKAATVVGIENFQSAALAPLLKWSIQLGALDFSLSVENLVEDAIAHKEIRHKEDPKRIVAFLSHSSKDKPFIRQLASDLESAGVGVWLDEHQIAVGDSIPDKISQGLAESDYFLIGLSDASVESAWVKKELNNALLTEIECKRAVILPIKLSECKIPELIKDKKYADFSKSYKDGLADLLLAMKQKGEKK